MSELHTAEVKDFSGTREEEFDNLLLMFEPPLDRGEVYYMGVDVSSGQGLTNSVVSVVRRGIGGPDQQAAEWASNRVDPFTLAKVVEKIGRIYWCHSWDLPAMACVENNNYGIGTLRDLNAALLYPNIFQQEDWDAAQRKYVTTLGFNTNAASRKAIITWGERALRKRELVVYSPMLIEEMVSFDTNKALGAYDRDEEAAILKDMIATARHAKGKRDDRILALFIAEWCANEQRIVPVGSAEQQEMEVERGGDDYRLCDLSASEVKADWERRFRNR